MPTPPDPWELRAMKEYGIEDIKEYRRLVSQPPSPKYLRRDELQSHDLKSENSSDNFRVKDTARYVPSSAKTKRILRIYWCVFGISVLAALGCLEDILKPSLRRLYHHPLVLIPLLFSTLVSVASFYLARGLKMKTSNDFGVPTSKHDYAQFLRVAGSFALLFMVYLIIPIVNWFNNEANSSEDWIRAVVIPFTSLCIGLLFFVAADKVEKMESSAEKK
jgi:hypothetical protein